MKKLQNRFARFEKLESRDLLAGGGWSPRPAPVPRMVVQDIPVSVTDVLPGDTWVLGKSKFSAATRNKGMLAEINLLPAEGSDRLSGNIDQLEAWANLKGGIKKDGPRGDGYETLIATSYPSWQTDVITLAPNRPLWISQTGVSVEYIAKANFWLDGDTIGAGTEYAVFTDIRGNYVDDARTTYKGADPTLHTIESAAVRIYQEQGKPFSSVSPHENWKLIEFNAWSKDARATSISFPISNPGNLVSTAFVLTEDTNWDGNGDRFWTGTLQTTDPDNGVVMFDLGTEGVLDGNYWVWGYSAEHALADNTFGMTLGKIQAVDVDTGEVLRGVVVNGNGSGQIQVWTAKSTTFALVENPALVIFSGDTSGKKPIPQAVHSGEVIVVASFTVRNHEQTAVSFTNTELVIQNGNFLNAESYTLWAYDSRGNKVEVAPGMFVFGPDAGSTTMEFFSNFSIASGDIVEFDITAIVAENFAYPVMLQAQINPYKTYGTDPLGKIGIDRAFYWLGDNPWYLFGDDGGGMG